MKQIKIGVDARILSVKTKGVAKVFRNLLLNITRIDPGIFFCLFIENEPFEPLEVNNSTFELKYLKHIRGDRFDSWMQLKLPFVMNKKNIDLSFFPANRIPFIQTKPSIVIVHDTKLLRRKPMNVTDKLNKYLLLKALKKAFIITTVSNYSKESMISEFALPPGKIYVIYNGISDKFRIIKDSSVEKEIRAKYGLSNNYVFALGSPNPDKNTSILIDVFKILRSYGLNDLKLLISGLVEKESVEYFEQRAKEEAVNDQIIITGYVSEEDLIMLYNFADIFLYPQTYEGFGLPPIEAMACGTPVIASNSSAIPEVVGDAAILVNPFDAEEIARHIIELRKKMENPSLKNEIIQKGVDRASFYSWKNAANAYVKLFRQLA